jgi:hypothetical protein
MERTLKLSHEQVATIKEALGIAEKAYSDLFKSIIELNNVRNNENSADGKTLALNYHDNAFVDLSMEIQKGGLDA